MYEVSCVDELNTTYLNNRGGKVEISIRKSI